MSEPKSKVHRNWPWLIVLRISLTVSRVMAANETGPGETAWARVERGTYEDESFDDPRVGHVLNATWEPDSTEWFAHLEPNGIDVHWSEG